MLFLLLSFLNKATVETSCQKWDSQTQKQNRMVDQAGLSQGLAPQPPTVSMHASVSLKPPALDPSDRFSLAKTWRMWKQRWNVYAAVSGLLKMPEEYQVGMLISAALDQTLIVINALPYATSSDRQKLSKVIQLLEEFCLAGENILFERHNFYKRKQGEDEPIENFITAVRTLAQTCDFTQDGKTSWIKWSVTDYSMTTSVNVYLRKTNLTSRLV